MTTRPSIIRLHRLMVLLCAFTGCSSLPESLEVPQTTWWNEEETEPQIPYRLVATWTDTVLNSAGKMSQRGFGGRILFFQRGSEDSVKVNGQLVVYAYDESLGDADQVRPTRRYIFPADQFARHHSDSALGPSYSVWLPWDEVGGPMKNISLITRFEPVGGPLIVGEQTRHMLPGEHLVEEEKKPAVHFSEGVQLTNHLQDAPPELATATNLKPSVSGTSKEMKTTTIRVPKYWKKH